MKKVLTIAGSDCSGGAGIQADLKTFSAHGVFGMSVIVSVVAENTSRVIGIQDIRPDMIEKQIDAVFEDIGVDAVKLGMLSSSAAMEVVAGKLKQYHPWNVVIDPVMYAKNGCPLMKSEAIDTLLKTILPLSDVVTPNIPEAEKIARMEIRSVKEMEEAARRIYGMGCGAVIIKGGHRKGRHWIFYLMVRDFVIWRQTGLIRRIPMGQAVPFPPPLRPGWRKGRAFMRQYRGEGLCDDGDRPFSFHREGKRANSSFLAFLPWLTIAGRRERCNDR